MALLPARPVDLRAQGEGVVEYSGKVACPSGRRCSTRNAVWCHSHPGFKSQRYRHCRPAPLGPGGFVMPSVYVWGTCGSAGVPGAGGPGCGAGLLGVPVGGGPPASRPRCELRSARRLEAWPGSAAAHRHRDQAPSPPAGVAAWPSGPSGALHTGGAVSLTCACASARCPARPRHCPLISHVIPLRLVQSLNLHRWNCNVFGVSRKMTAINYVRNLGGGGAWSLICGSARRIEARPGPAAAHGHRSQASCLEVFPLLSFACNSLTPAVRHLVKSPEFQRLHFKA